jgi:hypothetical protein
MMTIRHDEPTGGRDVVREWLIYLVAATVLASAVFNWWQANYHSAHPADAYMVEEMRIFIDHGDRNTAMDGYNLCVRIMRLEIINFPEEKPVDCKAIYYRFRVTFDSPKKKLVKSRNRMTP